MLLFTGSTIYYTAPEPIVVQAYTFEQPVPSIYCSCIATSRLLGANLPKGDAKDLQRNGTPTVGGVVILKYGDVYHTAYIQFLLKGGMWIQEGNKVSCKFTERFINFEDENIIGFWNEQPREDN